MGPIRLQTSTGGDTATVRYAGLQVIGLLATVLAILPPDNNPSPQAPPAARTYTVVKGDTLWTIALKAYGDGHRYTDIATANDITDPNRIDVGQQLTLP